MSNGFPSRQEVAQIRLDYPPGTRIELINMYDPYAPVPAGTRGTVVHVDDAGHVHMKWDNGRSLSLIPGEDSFRKIKQELSLGQQRGGFQQAEQPKQQKPSCPLIGQDGNIFNLIGIASRTLRENGMADQAREMRNRITQCQSYDSALSIIGEYVEITSVDEMENGMGMEEMT